MEPLKQVYKLALPDVGGDEYYCIYDTLESLLDGIKTEIEQGENEHLEIKIKLDLMTASDLEEMGEFPGW